MARLLCKRNCGLRPLSKSCGPTTLRVRTSYNISRGRTLLSAPRFRFHNGEGRVSFRPAHSLTVSLNLLSDSREPRNVYDVHASYISKGVVAGKGGRRRGSGRGRKQGAGRGGVQTLSRLLAFDFARFACAKQGDVHCTSLDLEGKQWAIEVGASSGRVVKFVHLAFRLMGKTFCAESGPGLDKR
jgi:hypothetical protein